MSTKKYRIIGVMSGTSLDGLDIAFIEFKKEEMWSFKIIHAVTLKYSNEWYDKLKTAIDLNNSDLDKLDIEYTEFLGEAISSFINNYQIKDIDAVCSHGHTVFHKPENGLTKQIGNKKELSSILGLIVVCDFRVQDVELGGQGAPLVPIGDELLFNDYNYCLNLGGFANISTNNGNRIAYDICPVNIVLNHYSSFLGVDYDDDGLLASQGYVNEDLLKELNDLNFYKLKYPKSLGLEWVQKEFFPLIDNKGIDVKDILRTLVEHIVFQIANCLEDNKSLLITGGGVYNSFLISRLQEFKKVKIKLPKKSVIEFKEAVIFGFLGVLRLREEINCLSSVTGAKKNHSTGMVYKPIIDLKPSL